MSEITNTSLEMKFSIKDFFSKCDQILSFLRIWLHLLKIFLLENYIFSPVKLPEFRFNQLLLIYTS